MEQYNFFRHLSDFKDEKLAIYVATPDAYNKLMQHLERHDYTWGDRIAPTKQYYFGNYRDLVVYSNPESHPKRLKYKDMSNYGGQIVEFTEWED